MWEADKNEKKRKRKKLEQHLKDQPISKEMLLKILHKAADNSKLVVDKIRVEVRKAQVARNLSDEQTMQLFQQNFEHSLDQLIGAIRSSFNVSRALWWREEGEVRERGRDPG